MNLEIRIGITFISLAHMEIRLLQEIVNKINMNIRIISNFLMLIVFAMSCTDTEIVNYTELNETAQIAPDYSNIVLPPNIAPLNFKILEPGEKHQVEISSVKGEKIIIQTNNAKIDIPIKKWKDLISNNKGEKLTFSIFKQENKGEWKKYRDIVNTISDEQIDSYLVYRLIYPGYEQWSDMGIYQRSLETFEQKSIIENKSLDNSCVNCHSFANNSSEKMMFHIRGKLSGTIVLSDGDIKKVNIKDDRLPGGAVYPYWHPNGEMIAFSSNKIKQFFHSKGEKYIEVSDLASDLIIYDVAKNSIVSDSLIASKSRLETFPAWSPEGDYLYYCSAKAEATSRLKEIKYDLLRISFDQETRKFGAVDTIISSLKTGLSVSFPRISPDGQYILFCMSDYGNFSIWHSESDLYVYSLKDGQYCKPKINSSESESYHTWSANGKWIVFSSRRDDGSFTRPYFSYHYGNGEFGKPFILPQKDPDFYDAFLQSYNIPELINNPVKVSTWELNRIAHKEAEISRSI